MSKVNIQINGSKGNISMGFDILPDDLLELLTLGQKVVSAENEAELGLPELDRELLVLLRKGQSLNAVKVKRHYSGMGFREAKNYVDELKAKYLK